VTFPIPRIQEGELEVTPEFHAVLSRTGDNRIYNDIHLGKIK